MANLKLWQFNLATFLANLLTFGAEGVPLWLISALCTWLSTKDQSSGRKSYRLGAMVWAVLFAAQIIGRHG